MEEKKTVQVPPVVMAGEAIAEADFWRKRSVHQATMAHLMHEELTKVKEDRDLLMRQNAEMQAKIQAGINHVEGNEHGT